MNCAGAEEDDMEIALISWEEAMTFIVPIYYEFPLIIAMPHRYKLFNFTFYRHALIYFTFICGLIVNDEEKQFLHCKVIIEIEVKNIKILIDDLLLKVVNFSTSAYLIISIFNIFIYLGNSWNIFNNFFFLQLFSISCTLFSKAAWNIVFE
jgi:hypothetical protein